MQRPLLCRLGLHREGPSVQDPDALPDIRWKTSCGRCGTPTGDTLAPNRRLPVFPHQPEPRPDGCMICDIVTGNGPAEIVREWDDALAIAALDPVVDGHLLVLPRTHVPDARAVPDVTAAVMRRAAEIVPYPANIITSLGEAATQTVRHLHVHLIPRAVGDGLTLPWTPARVAPDTARFAELLRASATGRRQTQHVFADGGGPDMRMTAELLKVEIHTLEAILRVLGGDLGPLYDWLPTHLWTLEMRDHLYGTSTAGAEKSEPVAGLLDGAMSAAWLHGQWGRITGQMTSEERNAAADAVMRHLASLSDEPVVEPAGLRWWA